MSDYSTVFHPRRKNPWATRPSEPPALPVLLPEQRDDAQRLFKRCATASREALWIIVEIKLSQSSTGTLGSNANFLVASDKILAAHHAISWMFDNKGIAGRISAASLSKAYAIWIQKSMFPHALVHSYIQPLDTQRTYVDPKNITWAAPEVPLIEADTNDEAIPSWFSAIHVGKHSRVSSTQLMDLFKGIRSLCNSDGPLGIDDLLSNADLDEMPPEAMIGVLRYSFPMRAMLPTWGAFVQKVGRELQARNIDPDRALRGLNAA